MAGVWSKSGHELAGFTGLGLEEEAIGRELGGELEGEGLLDGLGEGSGLGVAAVGVRRGSDFRAS